MNSSQKEPMVSIIIPMYNCERFMADMLSSISQQSYPDFEVICVNDGSTDGTEEQLRRFCEKDGRFTFITKENGGAGSARNAGLDAARGKYAMFLDADDTCSPDLLKEMVTAAEESRVDEVFCLFDEYNYKTGVYRQNLGFNTCLLPDGVPVHTKGVRNLYERVAWAPFSALFSRELIERHHLRFSTTKVANDVFFIYAYVSLTETVLGLHRSLLTYRKYFHGGSLTSVRERHTQDTVTVFLELHD